MKNHLKDGLQQFMGECYEAACCALCLIDVALQYKCEHITEYAKPDIDVIAELLTACEKGYIYFNWKNLNDNDNMFVQQPALFLKQLTGKKWDYRHDVANYKVKKNEYAIQRYERKKTGSTIGHFQRDGLFEPIKNSVTVANGKLVSTRICKALG